MTGAITMKTPVILYFSIPGHYRGVRTWENRATGANLSALSAPSSIPPSPAITANPPVPAGGSGRHREHPG